MAQALGIKSLRFSQKSDVISLELDLTEKTDYRAFVLDNPHRIIIDLPHFDWHAQNISKPDGFIISDVRQGALEGAISRIVFDLREPVQILSAENTEKMLKLEFRAASPAEFRAHKNDVFGTLTTDKAIMPEMQQVLSNLSSGNEKLQSTDPNSIEDFARSSNNGAPPRPTLLPSARRTLTNTDNDTNPAPSLNVLKPKENKPISEHMALIVIDPGHGGVDPGAIGAEGDKEKTVVLALGKELKAALEETGKYKVLMTREDDKFISLKERVAFARKHEADLFVSIHADSIHKSEVSGSSVYTLSKEASDAQTAKLAEKENKADLIAGIDLSTEDEQVAFILGDFLMTETSNQSKFFANMIVAQMKDRGVRVLDNPHRFAGFAVLKAPDIPSILIEAGFMSNSKEARMLTQEKHRKRLVTAIKGGIDTYFSHIGTDALRR